MKYKNTPDLRLKCYIHITVRNPTLRYLAHIISTNLSTFWKKVCKALFFKATSTDIRFEWMNPSRTHSLNDSLKSKTYFTISSNRKKMVINNYGSTSITRMTKTSKDWLKWKGELSLVGTQMLWVEGGRQVYN